MPDLRARLVQCFSTVFPNLSEEEIPLATQSSVASWDSLTSINLVMVIQEGFGVSIDPDDQTDMVSFELVLDYLRTHVSGA